MSNDGTLGEDIWKRRVYMQKRMSWKLPPCLLIAHNELLVRCAAVQRGPGSWDRGQVLLPWYNCDGAWRLYLNSVGGYLLRCVVVNCGHGRGDCRQWLMEMRKKNMVVLSLLWALMQWNPLLDVNTDKGFPFDRKIEDLASTARLSCILVAKLHFSWS